MRREHDLAAKVNMCGRYFLRLSPELLKRIFGTENPFDFLPVSNACPTQFMPVLVRSGKNSPRAGMARWGLLPSHASHDDKALCAKLKNARSETLPEKKSFADLWRRGRKCLVPASGFYEWPEQKIKGHPGYEISYGEAIAFAGLWNKHEDLVTFTILTTAAAPELQEIHSRMPIMFEPHQAGKWLEATPEEAEILMKQENLKTGFDIRPAEKPISQTAQPALV